MSLFPEDTAFETQLNLFPSSFCHHDFGARPDPFIDPDPMTALARFPDVPSDVLSHHATMIGQAGAAVVDSLLLPRGIPILPAPDGRSWDRLALIGDDALTIQIKTTTHPGAGGLYGWNIACGYRNSPRGRRRYRQKAFSLLGLVVLPEHAVLFSAPGSSRISLRPVEIGALRRDPLASFHQALHDIGLGHLDPAGPNDDWPPF